MSKKSDKTSYFDLDRICQLKVYGDHSLVSAVERELGFYLVNQKGIPLALDMEIELRRLSEYSPSKNPEGMSPYDFPGRHKLASWIVRFERLSQKPLRIRFYGNIFSRMILSKQIIEPAVRYLAQSLGFIFVHSSCLVKDEKGVLIAGRGGSGKTRLLLSWLKDGNPFLSDDFTILSYGKARRFITPLRIGARLLDESGRGMRVGFRRRMEIYSRSVMRRLLFNYARVQAKIMVNELFPELKIQKQADLKAVVLLEGASKKLDPTLEELSHLEMAEKLVEINKEEMYDFKNYLSGLSDRSGEKSFSEFFIEQRSRLNDYLKGIPCYRTGLLRGLSAKGLKTILERIASFL